MDSLLDGFVEPELVLSPDAVSNSDIAQNADGGLGPMPIVQVAQLAEVDNPELQALIETYGEPIGVITELTGEVIALQIDDSERSLSIGSPIFQDDEIETFETAGVTITFADETTFSLGPDSALLVDEYIYDPTTNDGQHKFSALKGVFVFVSGLVADDAPENIAIDTPAGTLGIRGTTVMLDVSTNAAGETVFTVSFAQGAGRFTSNDGENTDLSGDFASASVTGDGPVQTFTLTGDQIQNFVNALGASGFAQLQAAAPNTDWDALNLTPPPTTDGETTDNTDDNETDSETDTDPVDTGPNNFQPGNNQPGGNNNGNQPGQNGRGQNDDGTGEFDSGGLNTTAPIVVTFGDDNTDDEEQLLALLEDFFGDNPDLIDDDEDDSVIGGEDDDSLDGGDDNDIIDEDDDIIDDEDDEDEDNEEDDEEDDEELELGGGGEEGASGSDAIEPVPEQREIEDEGVGSFGADVLDQTGSSEGALGFDGVDTITSSSSPTVDYGGDGADVIYGSSGADTFAGIGSELAGDEYWDFDTANDRIFIGNFDPSIDLGSSSITEDGSTGNYIFFIRCGRQQSHPFH